MSDVIVIYNCVLLLGSIFTRSLISKRLSKNPSESRELLVHQLQSHQLLLGFKIFHVSLEIYFYQIWLFESYILQQSQSIESVKHCYTAKENLHSLILQTEGQLLKNNTLIQSIPRNNKWRITKIIFIICFSCFAHPCMNGIGIQSAISLYTRTNVKWNL